MSSSTRQHFGLTVSTNELGVELSVLDAQGETHVRTSENHLKLDLPRGLYTLRAERNGQYKDTMVRLTAPRTISPELPKRYSAIPLPGAESTHEYYTYNAWELSQNPTVADIQFDGHANSEFMLFLRAPDHTKSSSTHKTQNLSLKTVEGDLLNPLDEADVRSDVDEGYAGFSARMSAGDLILEDVGTMPRQIRLPLLRGFQTQVFLTYLGRPLYEDIRVLTVHNADISTRKNRDPYDNNEFMEIANQVDAGMAALQNNVEDIGENLINNFLGSKFSNPILGLLGAYLMLLRRIQRPDKSYDDRLPKLVIGNLTQLMPGSPDLLALKYLATEWLGEPEPTTVTIPPLFRVGAERLIHAAARQPDLIPEGSLFDAVANRLLGDSAWTMWSSIALPVEDQVSLDDEADDGPMGWVELAVADSLAAYKRELPIADLAERIGVTQRAINKAFSKLTMQAAEKPEMIRKEGYDTSIFKSIKEHKGVLVDTVKRELIAPLLDNGRIPQKISYQSVYPTIKRVLSEYSDSEGTISAEDDISNILDDQKVNEARDTLLDRIRSRYPNVTMADIKKGFSNVKTVRDIATMLVKKKKL